MIFRTVENVLYKWGLIHFSSSRRLDEGLIKTGEVSMLLAERFKNHIPRRRGLNFTFRDLLALYEAGSLSNKTRELENGGRRIPKSKRH